MPLWFFLSLCKSAVLGLHTQIQYVTPVKSCYFWGNFWIITNAELFLATPQWQQRFNVADRRVLIPARRRDELPGVRLRCSGGDIQPGGHSGRIWKPPRFIIFRCHTHTDTLSWKPWMLLRTQIYQWTWMITQRGPHSFQISTSINKVFTIFSQCHRLWMGEKRRLGMSI